MKELSKTYKAATVLLGILATLMLYAFRWAKSIHK